MLNRSLEACAPSFEHWIVVDSGDLPSFRSLQNNRTTVVAKEEVFPLWVRRVDTLRIGLRSNVWVQARGRPIRGWLFQQLVKLATAEQLSADVIVHADSDVVLLRPFSLGSVVDEQDRVRLYARPDHVDDALPSHVRWHRSAEDLLGIPPADLPMPDYISSLVPWRRENAVALLEHIEQTTGRHWARALAAAWDVSEYTLYGRFAQDVLANGSQFVAPSPLCADYYKRVPLTVPELTEFIGRIGEDAIAVSLTSKAGMRPEDYVEVLERQWAAPVASSVEAPREDLETVAGGRDVTRPRTRPEPRTASPRLASVSRVAGGTRRDRVVRYASRAGTTAAVVLLLVLMMVVLEFD